MFISRARSIKRAKGELEEPMKYKMVSDEELFKMAGINVKTIGRA